MTTTAGTSSEGFYNRDGSLQSNKVKGLSRTYVQYSQGELLSVVFKDPKATQPIATGTKDFAASIKIDTSINAPTVVFASIDSPAEVSWYPNGYDLSITSSDTVTPVYTVEKSYNRLSIMVTNPEFDGKVLDIKIIPNKNIM